MLTDTRRVEFALLPRLAFQIVNCGVSDVNHPDAKRCLELLIQACSEPVDELPEKARLKIIRRIERLFRETSARYQDQPAGKVALVLWYALSELLDQGVLELYEGSSMANAMATLQPMIADWFDIAKVDASAQKQARKLLRDLKAQGYYRAWQES